ncbi:MAG: hypothetical protein A2297_00895 [Elusimicrobia bacterium RIFOXYB2_FULL_48_7]|nr:MAG: hypothetical protein A2297_00895 [Elusimicrobia bacterium RIFOXYB2_FULL_48_7]
MKNIILNFLLYLLVTAPCFAAGNGTGTAVFLKIIPGARPAGMGNAFTAVSDDSNAIYTNPSGLFQVKSPQISASHVLLFENITNTSLNVAYPAGSNVYGLGITYLGMSDIESRDDTGALLPTLNSVNNAVISLVYSKKIGKNMGVGIAAKSISQKYGNYSGSSVGTDFSGLYRTYLGERKLSAGLAVMNIGSPVTIADVPNSLPNITKLGLAYAPSSRLLIAMDAIQSSDSALKICAGVEYAYNSSFVMRFGHNQLNKISQTEGICVGIGTKSSLEKEAIWEEGLMSEKEEGSAFDFDYALTMNSEDLGYSHRVSLTYKFGNKFR